MKMPDSELIIRDFAPGDEAAFRQLNEEWIVRYFAMEPKDEQALADPRKNILDKGGRVFFAVSDGRPIGCCALVARGEREYGVAKMAVTESARGAGIGRRLLAKTIDEARASGAARLYLETNSVLAPAIRLYESMGFRHIPPERIVPSPYARADVYMELVLEEQARMADSTSAAF